MQLYYFEIGNTLKLSVFDIEYRLLDHLVAQMTITGFKTCFLWDFLYKTRSILRDHQINFDCYEILVVAI